MNERKCKICIFSVVLIVSVLIISIIWKHFYRSSDAANISEGYARLVDIENVSIDDVQVKIDAIHKEIEEQNKEVEPETQEAETETQNEEEKRKKRENFDVESANFKKIFENSVVVGDSMVEAMGEYGFLYENNLIYKRGISVKGADELFESIVKHHPKYVFLAFGMNDLQSCPGKPEEFVQNYKEKIEWLQKELPEAKIYINSVLPIQDSAIREDASLAYVPQFNKALKEMCEQKNIPFIDNTDTVNEDPDIFEPDGVHMVARYYPQWMGNMAVEADLV